MAVSKEERRCLHRGRPRNREAERVSGAHVLRLNKPAQAGESMRRSNAQLNFMNCLACQKTHADRERHSRSKAV